jgi:RHS repeat-associated protein
MDNAPWFDNADQFNHKRMRLTDIDGSGTTDIIYLHREGVRLYFNQSGNSWSKAHELKVFPRVDDLVSIVPVDVLGNGTACLVWSSLLPGDATRSMRYVNLMGDQKPHLLVKTFNNLGAETRVDYAPSTKFHLLDKRDGSPWITRLPFPVHVVERVTTYDHVSRNRFVTRYAYHHGYFDGEEREFRGFGMVEQWDTEEFAALAGGVVPADNVAPESRVRPVRTRTWFHTGAYLGRDHVSDYFAGLLNASDQGEYFREPGLTDDEARALLLPDTVMPPGLTLDEEREACRALKGSMLRQEVYADDAEHPGATAEQIQRARTPYTVTEQNFTIRSLQPRGGSRHAVFFTHAREAVSYHYERNPADPRVQHAMTLEVDDYGNVLKLAAIGYGRRRPDLTLSKDAQEKQALIHITCTENSVTNAIDAEDDDYRTPLPAESRTYEVRKLLQERIEDGSFRLYRFDDVGGYVRQAADGSHDILYEDGDFKLAWQAAQANEKEREKHFRRPIEHVRMLYRPDDCGVAQNDPLALLEPRRIQRLALPGESYKLAFTPGLLDKVFQRPRQGQEPEALLSGPTRTSVLGGTAGDQGGYVDLDGNGHWWIPSGRSFYHPGAVPASIELAEARGHFFLPRRYRDPFKNDAFVDLDDYDLLVTETRDALGNRVTVGVNDYRVLQPRLVSDPNRNRTEVAFDTLGMVVGTAVMGKPEPLEGDSLDGFVADLTRTDIEDFFAHPRKPSPRPKESEATQIVYELLQKATTRIVYDMERFMRMGEPAFAASIARETHVSDLKQSIRSKIQISFSYSDGFGREIQNKIQAEPGPLDVENGQAPVVSPRWVGSGWTIFNNKGKPVRRYEPFFSKRQRPDGTLFSDHRFEFGVTVGVSSVLFYDPSERVVATLHPNHTYEKVVFTAWQQTTYDVNDTCAPRNQQTGDPRTDPDIGGCIKEYFEKQPADWRTWHAQRIGGTLGADEQGAAQRAAAHADTPTTAHFDALGRPFLTVARNRVVCKDHPLDGKPDEGFCTRVELDIEGNQREVRDERKLPVNHLPTGALEQRVVTRYAYDMLGNRIHQRSMEAGARWMLNDVAGKPIVAWDGRGHNFTTAYDGLRRPIEQHVRGMFSDPDPVKPNSDPRTLNRDIRVDRIEYGEGIVNAESLNLRSRIYRHFDCAGVVINARLDVNGNPIEAYDFKGNLMRNTRRLGRSYREIPDWSHDAEPQLETERFEASTRYDALNRPIQSVAPHSSLARAKRNVVQSVFNEGNLLERVDVWLERATEAGGLLDPNAEVPSPVGVANVDYDAKGQRLRIDYKNGSTTRYRYDPNTFRLVHLYTRRGGAFTEDCNNPTPPPPSVAAPDTPPWGKSCGLQNLHYTHDPAGNITHIQDEAQQRVFFSNQCIEPSNDYTYDALYRLIQATGREHLGQNGQPLPHSHDDAFRVRQPHPNGGDLMARYCEKYAYDAVGNFLSMSHHRSCADEPGWTRRYTFDETSLIEGGKRSNRLSRTQVGNGVAADPETYLHDVHGNMVEMPHLGGGQPGPNMHWDYMDRLRQVDLGGGGTAFYVHDPSGERVRKVWEKAPRLIEERIYLGGFEIFRKHGGAVGANTTNLERETLHVMDDKQRIALVETRTFDNAGNNQSPRQLIRYQFGNHLGSASLELDEGAQILSYEEYAPYGSSTYQAVRSETETPKRYRYTAKERDEESGLYYNGARYFAPWLGTWTSCDPEGPVDSLSAYVYVKGNPTLLHDPSGRQGVPKEISRLPPLGGIGETHRQWVSRYEAEFRKKPTIGAAEYEAWVRPTTPSEPIPRVEAVSEAEQESHRRAESEQRRRARAASNQPEGILAAPFMAAGIAALASTAGVVASGLARLFSVHFPRAAAAGTATVAVLAGETGTPARRLAPPYVGESGGASIPKAVRVARSTSQILMALRNTAVVLAQRRAVARRGSVSAAVFGTFVDRAFKRLVLNAIRRQSLPATLRVTPHGTFGVDVYDVALRIGWDVTTATVRQVAGHDTRYIGRRIGGIVLGDVLPLVYRRP